MFQPYVFFTHCSDYSGSREEDWAIMPNSALFPEGEGVTATSLGQRPSWGGKFSIIHRVPSVEGATATSLGILFLLRKCKEINRKNAPDELSLLLKKKHKKRRTHGA